MNVLMMMALMTMMMVIGDVVKMILNIDVDFEVTMKHIH